MSNTNDECSPSRLCYLPMIRELLEYNEGDELSEVESCPSRFDAMGEIIERHLRMITTPRRPGEKHKPNANCYLRVSYMKHLGGVGAISPRRYQMALELIAHDLGKDKVDDAFRAEVRKFEKSLPCPLD